MSQQLRETGWRAGLNIRMIEAIIIIIMIIIIIIIITIIIIIIVIQVFAK